MYQIDTKIRNHFQFFSDKSTKCQFLYASMSLSSSSAAEYAGLVGEYFGVPGVYVGLVGEY